MAEALTKEEVEKLSANPKLQGLLQQCVTESLANRTTQFEEWAKLDRTLKAFKDREKGDGGRLDETEKGQDYIDDVNVPLLFFIMDTMVAQLAKIFFSKDVVFTYLGLTADDVEGCKKLTKLVQKGMDEFQNVKDLLDFIRNAIKYGQAFTALSWRTVTEPRFDYNNGDKGYREVPVLSGTKIKNISPYRMILDPTVPPEQVDEMRFIGHWRVISKLDIERKYGVRIDKDMEFSWIFQQVDEASRFPQLFGLQHLDNSNTIMANLYVDIIPKDYGLEGDKPEIYHFCFCGFDRILFARPAKLPIGRYPYDGAALDGDGYDLQPISRLDLSKDLQSVYNFLFNSRLYAVRKGLDGDIVVDPSKINMRDVENRKKGRPANVYRLNQAAWGMPGATKDAITKLVTDNSTNNYMSEAKEIMEIIKIITGAVDPLSGITDSPSSRRTAEEIASAKQSAGDRIQLMAQVLHTSFFRPLGKKVGIYTQANIDHNVFLRLVNDLKEPMQEVGWGDFLVPFDAIVGDGYLTLDQTGLVNSWLQFIGLVFQNQTLQQAFNLVEMLTTFGEVMGIKDIKRYISNPGVAAIKLQAMQQEQQQLQAAQQPMM